MPRPEQVNKDMDIFYQMADSLFATGKSLKDIFEIPQKFSLNNVAFIYEENKKTIKVTYKEYKELVYRYAKAIKEALKDIPEKSYVGLKLKNSIKWPLCFWGLIVAGYSPLLINSILNKEDSEKLIHECDAKAILMDTREEYDVFSFDVNELNITSEKLENDNWANEVLFCTSGTTGESKVYGYTGEDLSNQIMAAYSIPLTSDDVMYIKKYGEVRHLMILPFSHIFGFVAVFLWFTFFGTTIVFPNSISSNDIVYFSKKYKISHIFGVPLLWDSVAKNIKNGFANQSKHKQDLIRRMMDFNNDKITKSEAGFASNKIVKSKVQKNILGKEIRFLIAGGSVLSRDTLETLNGVGYNLYNGYGMTEIGVTSVELSKDVNQRNRGAVGKALYGVTYKLIDNELCVKAPQIHSYHFINGKKLPTSLDNEGYYHTGDVAEIDGNGYVFIKGKKKDVIITSNGENIYPEELEKHFNNIERISNAVLVGDKSSGKEELSLVIELSNHLEKEEYKELENDIRKVTDSLPPSMRPTICYLSLGPLPINASLKVKRYVIVDELMKHKEKYVKLSKGDNIDLKDISLEEINPIIDKVIEVFSEVSGTSKEKIGQNAHFIVDLGGDSFTYMSLVSEIEEKFDIGIPSEELGKLNTPIEFALYLYHNKK